MRTLKVFESISVDGYFTDAHGDMSFAHAVPPDPEFSAWVAGNSSGPSDLLLGRKTYEMMHAFWTSKAAQSMPEVAAKMNGARKLVASRTMRPTWNDSHLLEGELVEAVRARKAEGGPPIVLLGSGSVAAQLGDAGLVDEYQLVVIPVALGGGRTLFSKRVPLRLREQRTFTNGNVVVTYAT